MTRAAYQFTGMVAGVLIVAAALTAWFGHPVVGMAWFTLALLITAAPWAITAMERRMFANMPPRTASSRQRLPVKISKCKTTVIKGDASHEV